jgi:hypothetical protein
MLTENLYTVNEAAAELRLSPWTLWDHLKKGLLVRTKVAGKTFLRKSELEKLIVDKINPKPRLNRQTKSEVSHDQTRNNRPSRRRPLVR